MDKLIIRKARKEDASEIIQLVKKVIDEVGFFPSNSEEFSYTVEQEEEFIEDIELFLVAEVEQKIVGSSTFIRGGYKKTQHIAMFGITILREYSNKGIGSSIVKQVIEHAKNNGIKKIELEVFEKNQPALKLYKKFGFICEGIKNNAIKDRNGYQNIVLMAKFF